MNEAGIKRNVNTNMVTLKKRIAQLRKESGISQNIFADELKVPRSTIAAWETGSRKPRASQLLQMSEYFNVTIDYMLGLTDEKHKSTVIEASLLTE